MKSPTHTVSTLALALDVDQAQVSRWKASGMPFGKSGRVTLAKAVAWLREHERRERPKPSGDELFTRRSTAEAELLELRLLREQAAVVDTAAVEQAAEEEAERVRAVVGTMPTEDAELVAERCSCTVRVAAAVLREITERVQARLAADENDDEDDA